MSIPRVDGLSTDPRVLGRHRVTSFEPIGLPRFRRILDSFANCLSRTLIRAGAFVAGICDFVTFFASTNASGN